MTAPAVTARVTPVGMKLNDGFSTLIAFELDPNVSFWEKTIQPPGLENGDPIDTTTMHNLTRRTKTARQLNEATAMSGTAAYDPAVLAQIQSLMGVEGAVTCHFSNGDSASFYGYLSEFTPQPCEEGSQPEASFTVIETDVDPATGEETLPVYTYANGTN